MTHGGESCRSFGFARGAGEEDGSPYPGDVTLTLYPDDRPGGITNVWVRVEAPPVEGFRGVVVDRLEP